jgi:heme/copper-type cytochrome/quinol oxidase subunit 4
MIYFSAALVVVALLLAFLHVREGRSETRRIGAQLIVAILALAVGVSTIITVYRIGDSGARSVWGNELSETSSK